MRMMRWLGGALAALSLTALPAHTAAAQGTTTGAVAGSVTDSKKGPVGAAVIEVRNVSNGARASGTTRENGRYFITNLEVGTYTVSVRRLGFAPETRENVVVSLTQAAAVDFELKEAAVQLQALTTRAAASAADFAPTRQGSQSVINDTLVRRVPNINRDVTDLARMNPQVNVNGSGNVSAAGQNNRFSNVQIDGVSLANRFGLGSSATVGAQVNGRALPFDAIKEFQILISPYDVRQGNFTGALVNAVTQSGTNDWKGTAFITYRDQEMSRDTSFLRTRPFTRRQMGASVGGPIIKDKLRFFATVETSQNLNPVSGPYFDPSQPSGIANNTSTTAKLTQAQVDSFTTKLSGYGIDAGSSGLVSLTNPLLNTFARLDWQVSGNTRVVLRNIYNDQKQDDFTRSLGTFNFTSNQFQRTETSNQTVMQLFTNFSNGFSNEFIAGATRTRFKRDPSVIAPQILVQNIGGTGSGVALRAGTENSSQGNQLDEDLYEIANNFTMPMGNHIFAVGTRNEIYKAYNAFLQNSYGNWTFQTLADFVANRQATGFSGSGGLGGDIAARFTAGQFAVYAQDQWRVTPRLTTTYGIRFDAPYFFTKPSSSASVLRDFGVNTSEVPNGKWQISPRIGFNWDVTGDQKNQLRGGVGLFQGIPAYVWMSNQYTNTGVGLAQIVCGGGNSASNGTSPAFTPTPVAPRGCGLKTNGTAGRSLDDGTFLGTVNIATPDLKFPQLLRATLGYDRKLPYEIVGTFEGLYSKSINNFFYNNINIPQAGRIDAQGRTVFAAFPATGIPTVAPIFPVYGSNVIKLSNQSKDYSWSASTQLRKRFNRTFEGGVAYTYSRSFSVTDLTSSVALSNWQFGRVYSGVQTNQDLAPSVFDQPHRIMFNGSYTAPWKKNQTSITFIYNRQSGTPFTYVYGGTGGRGDMNGDGSNANDPIYVPTGPTDAKAPFQNTTLSGVAYTAAQQADALDKFITAFPCLNSQRGQIMKRNSCRNPMFDRTDITIEQQLPQIRGERFTARVEIFNFANFLNKSWGQFRSATGNANLTLTQVQAMTNADPATQVPIQTYDPGFVRFLSAPSASQFYQIQTSLRISF